MKRRSLIKSAIGAALIPFIPKVLRDITPVSKPSLNNFAMMLPNDCYKHDLQGEGHYIGEGDYTMYTRMKLIRLDDGQIVFEKSDVGEWFVAEHKINIYEKI